MKQFTDAYGNNGSMTDNGIIRVIPKKSNRGKPSYVKILNHNGKSVCISKPILSEVIEMLSKYNNPPYIGDDL